MAAGKTENVLILWQLGIPQKLLEKLCDINITPEFREMVFLYGKI